ncbi:hypothetical protein [Deinococcus misasensis]|uniref:hypothetical protein n=1 Tax=Deinococcus misasensis TaxID=392413 RepID=UPI0012FB4F8D|nr:hypothetical protein [Deinococcus misasensis]
MLRSLYPMESHTFMQRHSEFYGWLSIFLLLIVLLERPLRLLRERRVLGVSAFVFAALHSWLAFDAVLDRDWERVEFDQWAMYAGLVALVGFVPLLMTSTNFAMQSLGRHWKTLLRLNVPLGVLPILHTVWIGAHFGVEPWKWTSVTLLLLMGLILGYRVVKGKKHEETAAVLAGDGGRSGAGP